jgi:cephalosporin-C deacetylase-like acetyl esterase
MPRVAVALLCVLVLAGCGGSSKPSDGIPRLDFHYDDGAPLGYLDHGRINHDYPIEIHDVSFTSGGQTVQGYLLLPPGAERRPAVVFVHGSGGDRTQMLTPAAWLAARNVVTLTLTEPSTSHPPAQQSDPAKAIDAQRDGVVRDVVAVRRALDVLRSLDVVDGDRIGYLGWSAGAKLGTFLAAEDDRVDALALLSAGADKLSDFVANAPDAYKQQVRQVLGSVDPLRYMAWAKPGSVLLEDGRKDEIVPQSALQNMVAAAPKDTKVTWYAAGHELSPQAYRDALKWLADRLGAEGTVPGATTG